MPDPFNPAQLPPDPAPVVPARTDQPRKPGSELPASPRRPEPLDPEQAHVGEVDPRGAFGVEYDAVTGHSAHSKRPEQIVPETETKRQRRLGARRPPEGAGPRPRKPEPGREPAEEETPRDGDEAPGAGASTKL